MADFYDLIIVGGGASGLFAALEAGQAGLSVLLLEHNDTFGRKLSITGNGKCNFTNLYQARSCYRGSDPAASYEIVKRFPPSEIMSFFKKIGIESHERSGRDFDELGRKYIYPASESAEDFVNAILISLSETRVKMKTRINVLDFSREYDTERGDYISVVTGLSEDENRYSYFGKYLILATGGLAAPETGCSGNVNVILHKKGVKQVKFREALTRINVKEDIKKLAGIRIVGDLKLIGALGVRAHEKGEIQFGSNSVSGIPAMDLSTFAEEGDNLSIDLFPEMSEESVAGLLYTRREMLKSRQSVTFFVGLLPQKMGPYVLDLFSLSHDTPSSDISDEKLAGMAEFLKDMELLVTGRGNFGFAQTTSGGVLLSECTESLELKKIPGVYLAGEMLDTDGICGGYNLTWAFASAHAAVGDIINRFKRDKQ